METIDRIAELMITIEEFSELLDEETIAVRAANARAVDTLLPRKQYLANQYTRQMTALYEHRADLAALEPSIRDMLKGAWESFGRKRDENIRALQAAQRATRRVVDIIVAAIRQATGTHVERSYGGAYKRSAEAGGMPTVSSCVSINLNKVL